MPNIDDLGKRRGGKALAEEVRPHHTDRASEHRQRAHQRETNDFLQELSAMQESRKYRFAMDTIEGIYTTVDHSGYVTAGQRRAINNIRESCGDGEI